MPHDEPMADVQGDGGAILLIVLFVTTVLAVIIGVVLTNVEVNLRNSTVAQSIADKTFAADGGVEYVIQRLREDPAACTAPNLSPWQQNNTSVTVSCAPVAGVTSFGSGSAIITTDVGPSSLSTAGPFGININGPTYVAGGLNLARDLNVREGPIVQAKTPCLQNSGPGNVLSPTPPVCTTVPITGGQPALPCLAACAPGTQFTLADRGPDPSYTTASGGGCSIFLPGKYTAAPNLGSHNYFASGVYYFENTGPINIGNPLGGTDVIGGKRGPSEPTSFIGPSPCADDTAAGVSDGSGVEWILGGTSAVSVSSDANTSVELFARQPAAAVEGASGISVRSVPAVAPSGYTPSSAGTVFSIAGGTSTQVAVRGQVYAPNAGVTVASTGSSSSELSGGVVASTLLLRSITGISPGPDGMVSAGNPVDTRQVFTISSVAQGGATKNVTTTAVIELDNGPTRSVVIDSWVTNAA
jgi:hypothetical protein